MVGGEGSAEWRGGEAGGGVAVRPGEWGGRSGWGRFGTCWWWVVSGFVMVDGY